MTNFITLKNHYGSVVMININEITAVVEASKDKNYKTLIRMSDGNSISTDYEIYDIISGIEAKMKGA